MVKNLFKNSRDFLFARQTNILSAATVIAGTVLLSRVLGLFKYRLLNDLFSVSDIGLFWASFRLPNTIFDIVVMGALTTAFIPVFTSYLNQDREAEANKIASTILNGSAILLFVLSIIFFIFADPLVRLIMPGLTEKDFTLVIPFTRIMLIGQMLPLVLGNFLTGIIQSHKRFLIPALAPVVYNLGIIFGIVFLSPSMGLYGAVWGVVIGAVLFLAIQIPLAFHLGFQYELITDFKNTGVRAIVKLIIPRTFGLIVNQLNYTINLSISTLLSSRAITIFNYAQQLQQLPISIFAATISQAALPTLSEEKEQSNLESFTKTFLSSFMQILFLTLPAAAVLIVLRIPIVRLVYGASKFDWPATVDTGRTLAFLGLSLVAESQINLLVRSFFALKISKTPVILGTIAVAINVILSIVFIPILHYPVWGLAVSAATADIVYFILLLFTLNQHLHIHFNNLFVPMLKMIFAALLTLFSLYIPMKLLDQLVFDTTRTVPLLLLTGIAGIIGLTVYLFFTWLLQIDELKAFLGLFGKINRMLFSAEKSVSDVVNEAVTEPSPTIIESNQEKN